MADNRKPRIISLKTVEGGQARLMDRASWPGYDQTQREEKAGRVVDTFHYKLHQLHGIDGQWVPRLNRLRLFDDTVEIFERNNTTWLRRTTIDPETELPQIVEIDLMALIEACYVAVSGE